MLTEICNSGIFLFKNLTVSPTNNIRLIYLSFNQTNITIKKRGRYLNNFPKYAIVTTEKIRKVVLRFNK